MKASIIRPSGFDAGRNRVLAQSQRTEDLARAHDASYSRETIEFVIVGP